MAAQNGQPELTAEGITAADYSPALSMTTLGQPAKASDAILVTPAGMYTYPDFAERCLYDTGLRPVWKAVFGRQSVRGMLLSRSVRMAVQQC